CAVQSPFVYGGAEILIETLRSELARRNFRTEVINIPFKSHPILDVKKGCLLWRLIDLTNFNDLKIDLVIATKFPSYLVTNITVMKSRNPFKNRSIPYLVLPNFLGWCSILTSPILKRFGPTRAGIKR
ncbi:hypothetical protein HKBW3S06_01552, partial [Candidatus Hakubella thermalkaliphila]